jgi:hypothetical protein
MRLAARLAPVDAVALRRVAESLAAGSEVLEGISGEKTFVDVEQQGSRASLYRLGAAISGSAEGGSEAAELGYRVLLLAAIAGSRSACRVIRGLGGEPTTSTAWLWLGRDRDGPAYRQRLAGFGSDLPVSDEESWGRIAAGLKARYAETDSALGNGR